MQKHRILKLVGLVLLSMGILVAISFIEVAIYSYFINPGHDAAFYEAHATVSAPWVAGIFGAILFFLVTRYWAKKSYPDLFQLAWLFPLVYVVVDMVVLLLIGGIDWGSFLPIFLLANGGKFAGSLGAYYLYKKEPETVD